jgi:hypothetical protein
MGRTGSSPENTSPTPPLRSRSHSSATGHSDRCTPEASSVGYPGRRSRKGGSSLSKNTKLLDYNTRLVLRREAIAGSRQPGGCTCARRSVCRGEDFEPPSPAAPPRADRQRKNGPCGDALPNTASRNSQTRIFRSQSFTRQSSPTDVSLWEGLRTERVVPEAGIEIDEGDRAAIPVQPGRSQHPLFYAPEVRHGSAGRGIGC